MPTALDSARTHLADLREELAAAQAAGLADNPLYRADLQAEIAFAEQVYVAAAVTEIAVLRGQLGDRNQG